MKDKEAIIFSKISKNYTLGEYSSQTFAEEFKSIFKKNQVKIGLNDRDNKENTGKVWALKDISLQINKGEVVGIIGKNGAGKSTLLKLLSRITSPSDGDIYINGRIGALLEVGTGFQPDLTGRENIFLNGAILGMNKAEIDAKLSEIVSFSGVAKYLDTPVKRYSSGMMVRLGFAVAAHLEPEILVIDEVLAVGDQEFQDQCVAKMQNFAKIGKTVLFVSHNMASVKSLCKRGIVLEKGSISFDGTIDEAIQYYLSKQEKTEENGDIASGLGSINTQEVVFRNIVLQGATLQHKNTALYEEDLLIKMHIDAKASGEKIAVELLIHSADNYLLGNTNNVFEKIEFITKKGENFVTCKISNNLLPGNYSMSFAIAQKNGNTLHFLENIISFKIEKMAINNNNPYPFVWINGNIRFNSSWIINKE